MENILNDNMYKSVNRSPTTYLEQQPKRKIKNSLLKVEIQRQFTPSQKSSKCPKIHKPEV